jgi:hypothetical protein
MRFHTTGDSGEDFGTIVITPERDDQVTISGYTGEVSISFPLYSQEAAELIEVLSGIAHVSERA